MNLLLQFYKSTHVGQAPRAATLKGLIIHTADECGSHDGPDYKYGWGLINTEHAADVIQEDAENGYNIQENVLDNGDTLGVVYDSDGDTPIALTICWTDVPANSPGPVLNDISLSRIPRVRRSPSTTSRRRKSAWVWTDRSLCAGAAGSPM